MSGQKFCQTSQVTTQKQIVTFVQQFQQNASKELAEVLKVKNKTIQAQKLLVLGDKLSTQVDEFAQSLSGKQKAKLLKQLELVNQETVLLIQGLTETISGPTPVNKRTVSKFEEHAVLSLIYDLNSRNSNISQNARSALKQLNLSEERIDQLKQAVSGTKKPLTVRFGSGQINEHSEHLLKQAIQDITSQHSSESIINVVANHHVKSFIDTLHPLLFSGGGWVVTGYDHNGFPIQEWSNNL